MIFKQFKCMNFHDKVAAVYIMVSILVSTLFAFAFLAFNLASAVAMALGVILFIISLSLLLKKQERLGKCTAVTTSYLLTYTQMTLFFPKVTQFHLLYIALLFVVFTIFEISNLKATLCILSAALLFLVTSLSLAVAPSTPLVPNYNPHTLILFNCATYTAIYVSLTVILYYFSTEMHKLRTKLTTLASLDPLTGLSNRRVFLEKGLTLAHHNASTGEEFALLMVDIDDFKQINDAYGHMGGDQVLIQLANLFHHHLRPTDFASRYGGEEFALLLPNTDATHAALIADRLCRIIAETPFHLNDGSITKVTISIGMSTYKSGKDFDMLVSHADSALYTAKSSGKNQFQSLVGAAS